MENPIKMDDLGIPDTAILGNLHMFMTCSYAYSALLPSDSSSQ